MRDPPIFTFRASGGDGRLTRGWKKRAKFGNRDTRFSTAYVSFRTYAVDEIGIKTVPLENKTFSIRCNYL